MNPGSQEQLKFPAGRLMQRPWGPHTLDEMCHTRFWVSLVATATVQLSITLGVRNGKKKRDDQQKVGTVSKSLQLANSKCYLDTGWSCSGP